MGKERLVKAEKILQSLKNSVNSFYDLYNETSPNKEEQKQDILRAIILFSCSGVDAIVKQLINDTLDYILDHDEGANNQFKTFTERKLIKKNDGINTSLIAELFTCQDQRGTLIKLYKNDLTSNSLQSHEELLKIGACFNINTIEKDVEKLKNIFNMRNQISHELDVDMESDSFRRKERTYEEIKDNSEYIISFIENFIEQVSLKLEDNSEIDDAENIVSL